MWWLEAGQDGSAVKFVRFGQQQIVIADIASMRLEEVRDPQARGLFLAAAAFVACGMALFAYVFDFGARQRFLLGGAFLSLLGLAGLFEASKLRNLRHFELTLHLKTGRNITFTSADRADIQALALRLAAEGAALG